MTSARCTAPIWGHRFSSRSKAACPVHGAQGGRGVPVPVLVPPPVLGDVRIREAEAEDESSPAEALLRLSGDPSVQVRFRVAENPSTPLEVLEALSVDEDRNVRLCVARNVNATVEVLERLMRDVDGGVVTNAARNPSLIVDASRYSSVARVAIDYSVDRYSGVQSGLAENPRAPISLLEEFACDQDSPYVRSVVASNPNLPVELLLRLSEDDYKRVRERAAEAITERICARFDVARENESAIATIRALEWWRLTAEDDEIALAKMLSPSPES